MEHAEYIADAVSKTGREFANIKGIITWVKLLLALVIPIVAGIGIATLILQLLVKPILVNFLVTPDFGFTQGGITYMLQYAAILIGLLFVFLFPFYQGYLSRCLQCCDIPDAENAHELFFAGWKVNALIFYYAIPLVVIFLLYGIIFTFVNGALTIVFDGNLAGLASVIDYLSLIIYVILEFVTGIFLALFAFIGLVHLARTGSLKESINMGYMVGLIKKIGWYNYLLCIVIIAIILLTVLVLFLGLASVFGYALVTNIIFFGLFLFVLIPVGVFVTRYLSNVYDVAFLEPEEDIEDFDDF